MVRTRLGRKRGILFPVHQINLRRRRPHTYRPLDAEDIRILTVLPGPSRSNIHVRLNHAKLDTNDPPSYEALSYTWGSNNFSRAIYVHTEGEQTLLAVTQNLHNALQQLRKTSSPRTLWVDATCINQSDVEERNQQVARMADIYESAAKVLIWIGPAADNSGLAIKALKKLASKIHVDWKLFSISAASEDDVGSEWLDHSIPAPFNYQTWVAIGRILDRSWFSRLWVWQEVSLAHNGAVVICGNSTMSWQNFCKAIISFIQRPYWEKIPNFLKNLQLSWLLCKPKSGLTLQTVLKDSRNAKCSDQRDRIYGVLSLVKESERFEIEPDYTKTTVQVFQDAMLSNISWTRDLNWLTDCELSGEGDEIPSWVPNWSIPRRCLGIQAMNACLKSAAQAMYHDRDSSLSVIGLHVGKIQKFQQIVTFDS
ncbi:MAG: hypothetical protein Q9180_005635 [Flavoplaca navasiana]